MTSTGRWFPSQIKLTANDITEIVLKVALNTIKQANKHTEGYMWLVNKLIFPEALTDIFKHTLQSTIYIKSYTQEAKYTKKI